MKRTISALAVAGAIGGMALHFSPHKPSHVSVSGPMPTVVTHSFASIVRHVVPPAVTNLTLTFFALDDCDVCLHMGPTNAWDVAHATNEFWSDRHLWTIQKSSDLLNWHPWATIDAPGCHQFTVTDYNSDQKCFYRVIWQ
jgi:hypothetical protein